MKTITLFNIVMNACAIPEGLFNPSLKEEIIELNEHVKRKQNE